MKKIIFILLLLIPTIAFAESCVDVANKMNSSKKLNVEELANILTTLNSTNNRSLPPKFVTKKEAKNVGWAPGKSLWSVQGLNGKSIGGDHFSNFEKRLPKARWKEADLSYNGGKRNALRILFSTDGKRYITTDHYRTFKEVPKCQ